MKKYLLAACLLLCFSVLSLAQIKHIEPLQWWIGMKNPKLQLLVHGDKIAELIPIINHPGVKLAKIHRADSPNYLFLDLIISPQAKAGKMNIIFQKQGKIVLSYPYMLLSREKSSPQFKGFDASDVIYLITPDRFSNGNIDNDSIEGMKETQVNRNFEGGRHGGDIRGIIEHLDYIKSMGFTAIWPTPMLENDMAAYSYHGYSITNHYKVDPRFGTLQEYIELAKKAQERGIKLIFDEVLNHTGLNYWWKDDLPFKNWINFQGNYKASNHRRTVNQDLYASEYDKTFMTKGWFDSSMPDMNAENPFLANYLIQNSIWWIETLHLGGIRQDTYGYSDKNFLKKWSCAIMDEYPNFSLVGEEWSYNPLITSYWQQGKMNKDSYSGCLTSVMDFPIQGALVAALKEKDDKHFSKGLPTLYEALANDFVYPNPNRLLIMADNHDMDRIYTQLDKDMALTKMAMAYLLTIRGIPQIYYGTEILMENSEHRDNHGYIRSDFPGGWQGDKINGFTGEGLASSQQEMKDYLRQLLQWRKNNSVIHSGKTLHFAPFDGIYVYFRHHSNKIVMIVMNKNFEKTTIDLARFAEILSQKTKAEDVLSHEKQTLGNKLTVAARAVSIFEIN